MAGRWNGSGASVVMVAATRYEGTLRMCVVCCSERSAATANGEDRHGGVSEVDRPMERKTRLLLEAQTAEMVGAWRMMR
jgi:hypothetical protein